MREYKFPSQNHAHTFVENANYKYYVLTNMIWPVNLRKNSRSLLTHCQRTTYKLCKVDQAAKIRPLISSRIIYSEGTSTSVMQVANMTPNARLIAMGIKNRA